VDNIEVLKVLSELETLGLTIYGEARGEPIEGQVGVACVIHNRVCSKQYKNYKEVCLAPQQFSCWNKNDPNYPILIELATKMTNNELVNDPAIRQCLWVAEAIINGIIHDNTKGSVNYMTNSLYESLKCPLWAKTLKVGARLGNHVFLYA
jgi:N-acetylmuramoyl-L-alanine amidase